MALQVDLRAAQRDLPRGTAPGVLEVEHDLGVVIGAAHLEAGARAAPVRGAAGAAEQLG